MKRILKETEVIQSSLFGGHCPYWTRTNGNILIADNAQEIFNTIENEDRIFDPTAVMGLIQFNYMLGDRTILEKVKRLPWHSKLMSDGSINRGKPIPHGMNYFTTQEISKTFLHLIEKEIKSVLENRKKTYLLLSGGLDSRILAGVIKKIEKTICTKIIAVSWGIPDSRDVLYAKQIASWFNWEFIHIPYNSDLVWKNIERGAYWGGSEVAGIHLHGMEWFENVEKNDIVITGLFGDGIGRAEYSNKHLLNIKMASIQNPYSIVNSKIFKLLKRDLLNDRKLAWQNEDGCPNWVINELDMQENYLRRMLRHSFDFILQYCDLYHLYTSEDIVSYIWSIHPICRTDRIYQNILSLLDERLYNLPWARTGIAYDGRLDNEHYLSLNYHKWGEWLRNDLRDKILEQVLDPNLYELGFFNKSSVHKLINTWLHEPIDAFGLSEYLVKICSIELTRKKFKIIPNEKFLTIETKIWNFPKVILKKIIT